MRKAQLLVLAGAVMAAGGAGYIALNLSKSEPQQVSVQSQALAITTQDVLVAGLDIPMGTRITSDMLRWQE